MTLTYPENFKTNSQVVLKIFLPAVIDIGNFDERKNLTGKKNKKLLDIWVIKWSNNMLKPSTLLSTPPPAKFELYYKEW